MNALPPKSLDALSPVSALEATRRLERGPGPTGAPRALPRHEARQGFERALRKAEQGAAEAPAMPEASTATPTLLTPTLVATTGLPLQAVGHATIGALPVADAASLHLARLAPAGETVPTGRWQLQLLDRSLPVQHLDLQRSSAGGLQLALGGGTDPTRKAPLDKLRERLVARGGEVASVRYLRAIESRGFEEPEA